MLGSADSVAQGTVPAGFDHATVGGPLSTAVRAISHLSFVDAMGAALLVAAGVSLLGALLALFLPHPVRVEPSAELVRA
jgi:hypothetical protein